VRGSLDRTIAAIRFLTACGLKVTIANVLMRQNASDYHGVRALANELGAEYTLDPPSHRRWTATRRSCVRMPATQVLHLFKDASLVGEGFCSLPRKRMPTRSTAHRAVRATSRATSRRMATCIRACSFRCRAATSGTSGSIMCGGILRS